MSLITVVRIAISTLLDSRVVRVILHSTCSPIIRHVHSLINVLTSTVAALIFALLQGLGQLCAPARTRRFILPQITKHAFLSIIVLTVWQSVGEMQLVLLLGQVFPSVHAMQGIRLTQRKAAHAYWVRMRFNLNFTHIYSSINLRSCVSELFEWGYWCWSRCVNCDHIACHRSIYRASTPAAQDRGWSDIDGAQRDRYVSF